MYNRRVLEELAGVRKTRQARMVERELLRAKRATKQVDKAAELVKQIEARLRKARDEHAGGLSEPGSKTRA